MAAIENDFFVCFSSFCIFFLFYIFLLKGFVIMLVVLENYHSLMKSMAFIAPSSNHKKFARFMCLLSWLLQRKMVFALTTARFIQVQTKNAISLNFLYNLLAKRDASLPSAALVSFPASPSTELTKCEKCWHLSRQDLRYSSFLVFFHSVGYFLGVLTSVEFAFSVCDLDVKSTHASSLSESNDSFVSLCFCKGIVGFVFFMDKFVPDEGSTWSDWCFID